MATRTVPPGLSRSPGFAACTQTSTVVVLGSTAGLTTMTFPAKSPSGPVSRAGRPTRIEAASLTGILARENLGDVHNRNDGCATRGHLARIDGPVGHHSADRAADLRVGELHGDVFIVGFGCV